VLSHGSEDMDGQLVCVRIELDISTARKRESE
jgi:hypothetical protein